MTEERPTDELGSLAGLLRKIAATSRQAPVLAPGTLVARRYRVERYVGRGGMGVVYAVHDAELDDLVALKLLHRELGADARYQQRLRAEVRLARRVSHPNVCRVHDIGQDGDQLFVTMELVMGRSLRQLLRERNAKSAPALSATIDLIVQVASALSAAHRAGVLHRDVKPDNVVVDDSRAVLTDFGVASLAHDREQVVAGTPAYIAPEVLRGEASDHRADVYSMAVLAYELATGVLPFAVRTLEEASVLAAKRLLPPPVPLSLGTPALRSALDRVFARALEPEPEKRIASMDVLAEAISHATRAGGTAATPAVPAEPGETPTLSRTTTALRRTEVRVATALVYRSDELGSSGSGEDLERIVVDAGGTPIAVGAFEISALFGVPVALGDDAERAVRAAQALIAHRRGRAGIDTVRAVLRPNSTALASQEAFDSTAQLVEAAGSGEILTSAITARQLAARFDVAGVEVGRSAARRIVGARPPVPRADAATFRPRELAALVALAEDCFSHRRPRHGEVRAPAGYGKTQLRDAMIARLRERREIDWLIARAELHGGAGPFSLLRAAHAAWFAEIEQGGFADRTAAFAAARRWLEVRSERQPVGIVLEDVQWADELSRAFFDQLVATLDDVPVLIVTFVRTNDDDPPTPHRAGVDVITLGPLDPVSARNMVRTFAPGAPSDAVDDVVMRAGGHPFFLEELARELAETGSTQRTGTPLPATIEAIVQVRLDRLDDPMRELVATAAVIGTTFWRDALVETLGEAGLDERLVELERLALITPTTVDPSSPNAAAGERYRFAHGLVRDVAYARIASRERRAAHAAIAAWLLQRFPIAPHGELGIEVVMALAHHLDEAGEPVRAASAYRNAGMRCLEASLFREATDALRRAAMLAPALDVDLASSLGDAVLQADTVAEAETWYERALALAPADDAAGRALLWHKLGNAASRRAGNARAMYCFEAGLALAAPDGANLAPWAVRDPRTAALLYGSLGWVAGYLMDDNKRGLPAAQSAVALLEGTPYRRELARALSRLGACFMRASRFHDQLACNRRNLEIAVEIGDVTMQTTARINLGVVCGVIGEIDEAIAHSEIARALALRSGARLETGLIESNLAGFYLECNRLDDAQHCLDQALVVFDRVGRRAGLSEAYGFAARLRAARGDLASAEHWAKKSLALADDLAMRLDQSIALRLLAQIRARAGDAAGALAALDDSTRRGAGLDSYEEARNDAARARVLRMIGDGAGADAARAEAVAKLTRFGTKRELAMIDVLDEVR